MLMVMTMSTKIQTHTFEEKFQWVKQTFEQNDAGFQIVIARKGQVAYDCHNLMITQRIKSVKNIDECAGIIRDWLKFFRRGHHAVLVKPPQSTADNKDTKISLSMQPKYWQGDITQFQQYLSNKTEIDYEGVWGIDGNYKIGIIKEGNAYIGFIIESKFETWLPNMIKLKIENIEEQVKSTLYMRDFSPVMCGAPSLIKSFGLKIGTTNLKRLYPKPQLDRQDESYLRYLASNDPYLEDLNKNTLYFRIPTFYNETETMLEKLVSENLDKITQTENLIIDIRSNPGDSTSVTKPLIPILHTNSISISETLIYASPLNIQAYADILQRTDDFDDNFIKYAKDVYESIKNKQGEFVNVISDVTEIEPANKVLKYPKNIGIILNNESGSTAEWFAMIAKQSKKVKLFGVPTNGIIDTANPNNITSPCGELELVYCMAIDSSARYIPLDDIGVQPDFLIDSSIPDNKWVDHVNDIMQNWTVK